MFVKGKDCGDPCKNEHALEGNPPPCEQCYPVPLRRNAEAVRVYSLVSQQVRTAGMGEIIGLDYNALAWIMELCGIQDRLDCLNRVNILFSEIQEMRADK